MGTTHLLDSKPNNLHWGAFSDEFDQVLKIKSGEQVVIETIS